MDWKNRLSGGEVLEITTDERDALLAAGEVLRDEDTKISGHIRVVAVDGLVVLQEQTPKNVLLVRAMPSIGHAEQLLADRLDTYDRMWDGCGCKVDYSS
jgi:hypothetical protein